MIAGNSLGIDYHERSIQVCVLSPEGKRLGNRKVGNAVREVVEYAGGFGPVRGGAVEASCGSAEFVDEVRTQVGWDLR